MRSVFPFVAVVAALGCLVSAPLAAEPLVGVDVGVTVPTSRTRNAARPGGALLAYAGYQHALTQQFSVGLVAGTGLNAFETRCGDAARICTDDDVTTILALTAGPRLTLHDGGLDLFFGARGGVYRGVSGGLTETAGGWALETGATYELVPGTSAGLLLRREQAGIEPTQGEADLEFLVVGLTFEHRFTPPPRAVSHPRHRP